MRDEEIVSAKKEATAARRLWKNSPCVPLPATEQLDTEANDLDAHVCRNTFLSCKRPCSDFTGISAVKRRHGRDHSHDSWLMSFQRALLCDGVVFRRVRKENDTAHEASVFRFAINLNTSTIGLQW